MRQREIVPPVPGTPLGTPRRAKGGSFFVGACSRDRNTRPGPSSLPKYEGLDHSPFLFDIERFESGRLEARGLRAGQVIVSQAIDTPEPPYRLRLDLDTRGRTGEGVLAMGPDGLVLKFVDLPKGRYKVRTWHHVPKSNTDSMDPNKEKLKRLKFPSPPYAQEVAISVVDAGPSARLTSPVTAGQERQSMPVAVAEFTCVSDGIHPIVIHFKDARANKGVWLNAFELSQWHADFAP